MKVLSLFDGMSCGRIALDRAGVPVTKYYASEVDKYAQIVSAANYPDIIHLGDVTDWRNWDIKTPDLIIAGSPCQGFSFAGKQLNFEDPRSKLFFEFVDILNHYRQLNSDIKFMLENVNMKKEYLDTISQKLGVEPIKINSALVSAQNRVRWYWTNIKNVEQPEDKGVMLKDVLEYPGTGWIKNLNQYHSRNNKSMCLDANYFKGVDNHGQRTMIKCGSMIGRRINQDTGRRDDTNLDIKPVQRIELRNDDKTGTLTTVQKDNIICNKDGYRKLTPEECEQLQTVPDNYTKHVSNTQRYKMLGNGWTVDVVAHIFKGLQHRVSFL